MLLVIIAVHIFILSRLIFFPYPELFVYPYLTKIGLLPYRDILDQHFPGVMFFPVNLATLGIDTPGEMKFVQYFLVILVHVLLFTVSKRIIPNQKFVILPNLLYLVWQPYFEGYVLWIDSFMAPILLSAYFLANKFERTRSRKELFLLGFVFGVAVLFKQVTLPLILIYATYLWIKFKNVKFVEHLALGLLIPGAYLLFFLMSKGVINDFFYWTVTFNLTTFADMGRKFISVSELVKIFPMFGLPLLGLSYFYFEQKKTFIKDMLLLGLFLFGALFFAYARFDFVHLQPALPFTILIFCVLLVDSNLKQYKNRFLSIFAVFSALLLFFGYKAIIGNKVLFYGENERKVAELVNNYSDTGESVFAFGTLPHIYQMTDTVPSGRLFVFQFHWFMKEAQAKVLKGLEADPPKVVVMDSGAMVSGVNLTDYSQDIKRYIDKFYHTVDKVGEIEIMLPN